MTASPATSTDPAARKSAPPLSVRRDRLTGVVVLLAGILVVTVASQLHHHVAPSEAGGWRELPTYAISGVVGWLVAFGIAYVAPHRAAAPAAVSRRVGLGLAVVGLPAVGLLWWTPIPFCLAAAALLLVRRARGFGTASRWDVLTLVLVAVDVLAPLVIATVRIVQAAG